MAELKTIVTGGVSSHVVGANGARIYVATSLSDVAGDVNINGFSIRPTPSPSAKENWVNTGALGVQEPNNGAKFIPVGGGCTIQADGGGTGGVMVTFLEL